MGSIIAQAKAPSCKFSNPKNGDTIAADTTFTMTMNIVNLQTGSFTNAQKTYFAAPAQLNSNGILIGHSHVVIESIASLDSTTPADTTKFAFFKGLNDAANNGVLSATVTGDLPAGFYKMSSINSAANHQLALVGVAQHGSLDDIVYFTVAPSGAADAASSTGVDNTAASATTSEAVAASTVAMATEAASTASATDVSAVITTATSAESTDFAAATAIIASSAAAATSAAAVTSTGNFQVFTGTLGGPAPSVIASNGQFVTGGSTKNKTAALALSRSCQDQKNTCNTAAGTDTTGTITVAACSSQRTACRAANGF